MQSVSSTLLNSLNAVNQKVIFGTRYVIFLVFVSVAGLTVGQNPDEQVSGFEGDVALVKNQLQPITHGEVAERRVTPWPHRIIPFKLSKEIQPEQSAVIYGAMQEIMHDTCIRFIPRKTQTNYVYIQLGKSCSSSVGQVGLLQNITLRFTHNPSSNCVTHGEVMHELMHAIGFWHEQNRPDRNQYVQVWPTNAKKAARNLDFNLHLGMKTFNLPYDYSSILHYSSHAFQRNPVLKTIEPKVPEAPIGVRNHLSHLDKVKISLMYNCPLP